MASNTYELLEFHDSDLQRVLFEAKSLILDFTSFSAHVRESDTTNGIWLCDATLAAEVVTEFEFKSPLGLGLEADCIYSASFSKGDNILNVMDIVSGVEGCQSTFSWAISGSSLRFHSQSIQLHIGRRVKRLGTWDLTAKRMRP